VQATLARTRAVRSLRSWKAVARARAMRNRRRAAALAEGERQHKARLLFAWQVGRALGPAARAPVCVHVSVSMYVCDIVCVCVPVCV